MHGSACDTSGSIDTAVYISRHRAASGAVNTAAIPIHLYRTGAGELVNVSVDNNTDISGHIVFQRLPVDGNLTVLDRNIPTGTLNSVTVGYDINGVTLFEHGYSSSTRESTTPNCGRT